MSIVGPLHLTAAFLRVLFTFAAGNTATARGGAKVQTSRRDPVRYDLIPGGIPSCPRSLSSCCWCRGGPSYRWLCCCLLPQMGEKSLGEFGLNSVSTAGTDSRVNKIFKH